MYTCIVSKEQVISLREKYGSQQQQASHTAAAVAQSIALRKGGLRLRCAPSGPALLKVSVGSKVVSRRVSYRYTT